MGEGWDFPHIRKEPKGTIDNLAQPTYKTSPK